MPKAEAMRLVGELGEQAPEKLVSQIVDAMKSGDESTVCELDRILQHVDMLLDTQFSE